MSVKVAACYIYPLKSAGSIQTQDLNLTAKGPENDRLWMLAHAEGPKAGKFISQRDRGCEKLALVKPDIGANGLISFSVDDAQDLELSSVYIEQSNLRQPLEVQGDKSHGLDAGDAAANWFSDYLGTPCRLFKMPDDEMRAIDPSFSQAGDHVSFADGFPLLITNTASLESLSVHFPAGEHVNMERFRPNIVLDGIEAFEEDVIHTIRIGDVHIEFVKPCSRCKLTTVDQESGLVASKEPLATLSKVRRGKTDGLQGVFFGQNAVTRHLGTIAVGDDVEILSKKPLNPVFDMSILKADMA